MPLPNDMRLMGGWVDGGWQDGCLGDRIGGAIGGMRGVMNVKGGVMCDAVDAMGGVMGVMGVVMGAMGVEQSVIDSVMGVIDYVMGGVVGVVMAVWWD